ncbi:MAG TPA: hypothetical protein VMR41_02385 [Patescibacteria group bacterium]|nr:hypothetical protein [Patescibacteria group bacterium]
MMVIILYLSSNALSTEKQNTYSIDGNYSYHDALRALGLKTNRSVLGATSGLELIRPFDICNKSFKEAVEEVKKNLKTDGYLLYLDTNMFYVVREDSLMEREQSKKDSVYVVLLPYSKHYVVTSSKSEYLNSKIIDRENYVKDSIEKYHKTHFNVYRCDMYMIGSTVNDSSSRGILLGSPLNLSVSTSSIMSTNIQLGLVAGDNYVRDSLNFQRHLIFFLRGDSSINLMFGDESRRSNAVITSATGAVSTSYESVYNGLNLDVGPTHYRLTYRLDANQIALSGVPGSLVVGSSLFNDVQLQRNWLIFKYHTKSMVLFYFAAYLNVQKMQQEIKEE